MLMGRETVQSQVDVTLLHFENFEPQQSNSNACNIKTVEYVKK